MATTDDPETFARWRDFAARMALHAWPHLTERRRARLHEEVCAFIDARKDEPYSGWEGNSPWPLCDSFSEYFDEYWAWSGFDHRDKLTFYRLLSCCVRAGIDAACGGFGVIGFTVGDLRRMYAGEIPAWLAEAYDTPITAAVPDEMTVAL